LCGTIAGGITRRQALFPLRSDGVVGIEFQSAGSGSENVTNVTNLTEPFIAHAPVRIRGFDVFGVPPGAGQTTHPIVAEAVNMVLDGGVSQFKPFQPVTSLDAGVQTTIDSIIPLILTGASISVTEVDGVGESGMRAQLHGQAELVHLRFSLPEEAVEPGTPFWWIETHGAGDAGTDGIFIDPDPLNPTRATVSISPEVTGDVVAYASYVSDEGTLYTAPPVLIASRSSGVIAGIEIEPDLIELAPGEFMPVEVWAIYDNGIKRKVFAGDPPGAWLEADASGILQVNAAGWVRLSDPGTATLSASYRGFTATAQVYSRTDPTVENVQLQVRTFNDGLLVIEVTGLLSGTVHVESSDNLYDWSFFREVDVINGQIQLDGVEANRRHQFFRAVIR
jgi:hypothetical protein